MKSTVRLIAFLAVVIVSCRGATDKAPITSETFVDILTDMHTAEALAEAEYITTKDSLLKIYYQQILKKHGVTSPDFDSTLAIYSREPIALDSIYAQVMYQLQKIDTTRH